METKSMAEYFNDEGERGHIGFLVDELVKEIDKRYADLQIVDELGDSIVDAEFLEKCKHDNDIIIGMIYSAQAAVAEVTEMLRLRPVFAAK